MTSSRRAASALFLVLALFATGASASVIIAGTRVVFPAAQGEVTVRLSNQGDRPALVEAWIDAGDAKSSPDTAHSPFLITPPLFRMNAHKDQSLRILFTSAETPLASDRESLFWLNVLEIPPKPKNAAGKNLLQFAIRSRLKLFYRPANLKGDVRKAPETLTWTAVRDASGVALAVHNPSPYYITISEASLTLGGAPVKAATGMVAPFGDLRLALKDAKATPAAGTSVAFTTINDYGAGDHHTGTIAP
ncbi:MAG TPA: molecular chaperone [Rhodanobacteraceae bacterium]|nr:molecular chaperone [Rhodanobacteraceae bacterium]